MLKTNTQKSDFQSRQLRLLFDQSRTAIIGNVIMAGLVVASVWDEITIWTGYSWLSLISAAAVMRALLSRAFRLSAQQGDEVLRWEQPYLFTLALTSLLWGLGLAYFATQTSDLYQLVLGIFAVGMCGAAFASYSANFWAVCIAMSCILIPLDIVFLFIGEQAHYMVVVGSIVLVVAILRNLHFSLGDSFKVYTLNIEIDNARQKIREIEILRIQAQLDQAEEILNAKDEFVALINHEIRTPLHAITGIVDIISRSPISEKQEGNIKAINIHLSYLNHIISDLLEFTKLKKIDICIDSAPFKLPTLVNEIRAMFAPACAERGLELIIEIDADVGNTWIGDSSRIKQILVNLIGNACKFTAYGAITVTVTRSESNQIPELSFSVQDTGPGIDRDNLDQIFQPYMQFKVPNHSAAHGIGLGLAIVTMLVDLMHGVIEVTSELGKGSVFIFSLPLAPGNDPADASEPFAYEYTSETAALSVAGEKDRVLEAENENTFFGLSREVRPKRILVADDLSISRLLIGDYLADFGVDITYADNGTEAASLAGEFFFDLIIIDERMPGMTGSEVAAYIRRFDNAHKNHSVPIILQSADSRDSTRKAAYHKGVTDFLRKPYTRVDLQDLLRKHIHNIGI